MHYSKRVNKKEPSLDRPGDGSFTRPHLNWSALWTDEINSALSLQRAWPVPARLPTDSISTDQLHEVGPGQKENNLLAEGVSAELMSNAVP
jgi:hypothetical protein